MFKAWTLKKSPGNPKVVKFPQQWACSPLLLLLFCRFLFVCFCLMAREKGFSTPVRTQRTLLAPHPRRQRHPQGGKARLGATQDPNVALQPDLSPQRGWEVAL